MLPENKGDLKGQVVAFPREEHPSPFPATRLKVRHALQLPEAGTHLPLLSRENPCGDCA